MSTTEPLSLNLKYYRNLVRETNLANVAVLFVESFPLILARFIFPYRYVATIRMGLYIICFMGSQVDFPNKCVLQSLNISFTVKTLYNITRYNRTFNIRQKIAGNGSVSIKIPSL